MNMMKFSASALALLAASATAAAARDQIQVAGSSTVLPYATIVAEACGENFDFPSPVVEGGGSGAGTGPAGSAPTPLKPGPQHAINTAAPMHHERRVMSYSPVT